MLSWKVYFTFRQDLKTALAKFYHGKVNKESQKNFYEKEKAEEKAWE